MGFTKSPQVASSQTAVHKNLEKVVARYLQNEFQNSIPKHAHDAFNIAQKFIQERNSKIILDSGCGTAESTHYLARQHPDYVVIGLDKSSERLGRCAYESSPNLLLLHADCIQFWQLAQLHHWRLQQHYLFYPNPWPKPGHLQRRWHAHPVFPSMMKLKGKLTLRTNWKIYAQEFAQALSLVLNQKVETHKLELSNAVTAHERKYLQSEHELFEVVVDL